MDQSTMDGIDSVFQILDREVWILTAQTAARRGGLTATWVLPGSLDPNRPVLVAGLAPHHFTTELVDQSGVFAAHLLSADQSELALAFATGSGRDRDKLAGRELRSGPAAPPVLHDCLAWLRCQVFGRVASGDRVYFWADVIAGGRTSRDGPPLREKAMFGAASELQRTALRQNLLDDVAALAPLQAAWRSELPAAWRFRPS